jgi:hypothetical protein
MRSELDNTLEHGVMYLIVDKNNGVKGGVEAT